MNANNIDFECEISSSAVQSYIKKFDLQRLCQ